MSQVTQPRVRRVWVVLGASVLSSLLLATPALAGDVQLSGLQSAPTHQRFIVKYRDGSAPVANTTALASSLKTAAAGIASSQGRALGLQQVRKLAVGSTVVRTDRALDQADAELLMRKLAADPNVEYVEVDQIMRATLTPNDTRFSEQWGFGTSNASINVRPAWDKATGTGAIGCSPAHARTRSNTSCIALIRRSPTRSASVSGGARRLSGNARRSAIF